MAFQIGGKAVAYIGTYRGVGLVVEGTSGYYPITEGGTQDGNRKTAEHMNTQRGVGAEDAEALEIGSAFGWHVPGAGRFRRAKEFAHQG